MSISKVQCNLKSNEQKIGDVLIRLKSMRDRVADLREQCESLKQLQGENFADQTVCWGCGKEIALNQRVLIKDNLGNPQSYYHKDCFKALWLSENWKLSYSSCGSLEFFKYNP